MLSLPLLLSTGCVASEPVAEDADAGAESADATAQDTIGTLLVSTDTLDFGASACGAQAAPMTLIVRNTGEGPLSWRATLEEGAAYSVLPVAATLEPGEAQTLTVTPERVPATPDPSVVVEGGLNAVLTIAEKGYKGDERHEVRLVQGVQGAVIEIQPAGPIEFGSVPVDESVSYEFRLVNTGTADTYVNLKADNPAFLLRDPGFFLPAGGDYQTSATFHPSGAGARASTITVVPEADSVLCALVPTLQLAGEGNSGAILVDPPFLDFGLVPCGTHQAGTKLIVLSNSGTSTFNFSTELSGGSLDYELSPMAGSVEPGQHLSVFVTPDSIPRYGSIDDNFYGNEITLTTDIVGDSPHSIPLRLTAQGAVIELATSGMLFPETPVGQTGTCTFTVRNKGNVEADVSFNVGLPSVFGVGPLGQAIPAGGLSAATGYFSPNQPTSFSDIAQVTIPDGTPYCGALPSATMGGAGI